MPKPDANLHNFSWKLILKTKKYDPGSHIRKLQPDIKFLKSLIEEGYFLILSNKVLFPSSLGQILKPS